MKAKHAEWLIGLLFAGVGAIFLIAGIFLIADNMSFRNNGVEGVAKITDIESYRSNGELHHRAYVRYEVDGKVYDEILNYYSSSMYIGQEI